MKKKISREQRMTWQHLKSWILIERSRQRHRMITEDAIVWDFVGVGYSETRESCFYLECMPWPYAAREREKE